MREIKFRAWLPGEKRWISRAFDFVSGDMIALFVRPLDKLLMVVITQYTGLHDKNGKEVYEGDVLRSQFGITGPVVWDEDYAGFIWEHPEMVHVRMGNGEVIGNIYENPELVKP